ncbi:MAG TPA: hypothetical protein VM656_02275 [Pyrinomonadaceae bacterium]|jgi:hypothetical protein|nr:hypothetical protein [Pyrinomonadaceae bacterium]
MTAYWTNRKRRLKHMRRLRRAGINPKWWLAKYEVHWCREPSPMDYLSRNARRSWWRGPKVFEFKDFQWTEVQPDTTPREPNPAWVNA